MGRGQERSGKKGDLFVVATPIGNLEDLTFRALRILKEAAVVACEDTRRTGRLLSKHGFKKRLISYYKPREKEKIPLILHVLREGDDVALVSDSGTPAISDPGYLLIKEALEQGINVIPVPGPSALTSALSASGLPTHRVLFIGFPPPKKEAARKLLLSLKEEESTLVFYIPARKATWFLAIVEETIGSRQAVLAREMTKIHEEFLRGDIKDLRAKIERAKLRGEVTLLIRGCKK